MPPDAARRLGNAALEMTKSGVTKGGFEKGCDMRLTPRIVLFAAVMALAGPAAAADHSGSKEPTTQEKAERALRKGVEETERALRKGAEKTEKAVRETTKKVMKSLNEMFRAIPQYELPTTNERGDIIIRRKDPKKERKPPSDGDATDT